MRITSTERPLFDYPANTTAMLVCESQGGPNNTLSWSRMLGNGAEFDDNVMVMGGMLVIMSVMADDGGQYSCEVANAAGNDSDTITLTGITMIHRAKEKCYVHKVLCIEEILSS